MSKPEAVESKATILLLGRFQVLVDGLQVDDQAWRGRKAQQLVKLLAVTPGRSLHREQIADALWPDLDAEAADRQLHKAIHAARRAFEPGIESGSASSFLFTQDRTATLSPDIVIDADVAEASADRALAARDWKACEAALSEFQGQLLQGDLYDEWTESRRTRISALQSQLLATVAEGAAFAGGFDRARDAANQLLAIDRADERAHRALMRVAAASGDRSAIVRQFRMCEAALKDELGVAPSDATLELHAQLVEGSFEHKVPAGLPASKALLVTGEAADSHVLVRDDAAVTPTRSTGKTRRVAAFFVAFLIIGIVVVISASPRARVFVFGNGGHAAGATILVGQVPMSYVRVSSPESASGWTVFSDADGRFALRDAGLVPGDTFTIVIEGSGSTSRSVALRVPAADAAGIADIGVIESSWLVNDPVGVTSTTDGRVPFDRTNGEWYSGVAAAVTSGLTSDHDRVNAMAAFVSKRYARPNDNGPTDTPRRTIENGTLFSGPLPIAFATLAQAAKYPTRLVTVTSSRPADLEHTVVEVFYDGRWHLFDPAFGIARINDLGEVANLEDLVHHPILIDRMPYASAVRPGWRGSDVPALLRSGVHRITTLTGSDR